MKPVVYLAHPVSGDPRGNAMKAVEWIKWLTLNDPDVIYVAPWVAEVLAFADEVVDPAFYDRVLTDDEDVVLRLNGVLMVGGKISVGMARERTAARVTGRHVLDWTKYTSPRDVPAYENGTPHLTPSDCDGGYHYEEWMEALNAEF